MFLAELSGLEASGIICAMIFGGLGAIFAGVAVFKKQDVKVQQPVEVQITEELHNQFASKHDFDEHVRVTTNEFRQLRNENRADRDKIADVSSAQINKVYERIESVRKELSEKMDDVPDRVITTLTNTGAIGRK